MNLGTILADGTMQAAVSIITDKQLRQQVDLDKLTDDLRVILKGKLDEIIADLKEAMDCHMGEPICRAILSTHCTAVAIEAIKQQGLLQ